MRVLKASDRSFPPTLKEISPCPAKLWVEGEIGILTSGTRVAIVGAREATQYGLQVAEDWAKALAEAGLIVVSGLAYGIDAAAHRGCLAGGGKTIAVLGCGISYPYPAENLTLKREIIESGCVVTEFPPETPPQGWNFPQRNRIISGLSVAVVVVEAGEKSGALVTANWALSQGKEVYAVPGNIHSVKSVGTNRLIQQGATPVLSPEDLLGQLKLPFAASVPSCYNGSRPQAPADKILSALGDEIKVIDELVEESGLKVPEVSSLLVHLEMEGRVEGLAGGRYRRTHE